MTKSEVRDRWIRAARGESMAVEEQAKLLLDVERALEAAGVRDTEQLASAILGFVDAAIPERG